MKILTIAVFVFLPSLAGASPTFLVGKRGALLMQRATEMVVARDGRRLTATLSTEVQSSENEFAWLFPIPGSLPVTTTHAAEWEPLFRLEEYSGPQLVEFWDSNPCGDSSASGLMERKIVGYPTSFQRRLSKVDYEFSVLGSSFSEVDNWLQKKGFMLTAKDRLALVAHSQSGRGWVVARVHLAEPQVNHYLWLPPIQVGWDSPLFTIPIQSVTGGYANDLTLFVLTRRGRVEAKNYSSFQLPTEEELPLFVKQKFREFYKALLSSASEKEKGKALLVEYQGSPAWCEACHSEPLTKDELAKAGAFWLSETPLRSDPILMPFWGGHTPPLQIFLTRFRLAPSTQPVPFGVEFTETDEISSFRSKYLLRHPWKGTLDCPIASQYVAQVRQSTTRAAFALGMLTQWSMSDIYQQLAEVETTGESTVKESKKWYDRIKTQ